MTYEPEEVEPVTVLMFEVADQAQLLGIVNALYNTAHVVLSLEQVAAPDADGLRGATQPKPPASA